MSIDDTNGLNFRRYGDNPEALRYDARKLQTDMSVDIGAHSAFAPGEKIDLDGASKLKPESGDGLRVAADLNKLDDGLRKLAEQQANARLSRLLEQARQKMGQGKFHSALTLISQALEIDATSAQALLLKARCHHALGEFGRALDVLAEAQEHAHDNETVMLILQVRAACEQGIVGMVEAAMAELMKADRAEEALAIVERELRRMPDNLVLRYHHGGILLVLRRLSDARASVEATLETVAEDNQEVYQRLYHRILTAIYSPQLDAARDRLRARDPKGAVRHLEQCPAVMRKDDDFAALWSYTQERYASSAWLRFVERKRARQSEAAPLPADVRQSILLWLLGEELQAGTDAMQAGQFGKACLSFAAAEEIDDRSGIVSYLHALAEFRVVEQSFAGESKPNLADADQRLSRAGRLAAVAADDPIVREQGTMLAEMVAANLTVVQRISRVVGCVDRFNELMNHYQRRPISSQYELTAVKGKLKLIKSDAERTMREFDLDEHERKVLQDLVTAVQNNLRPLR